jgi:carboxymethylenebutenolidase
MRRADRAKKLSGHRPSYRKDAAEDGWNQMQAWLKKYGVLG